LPVGEWLGGDMIRCASGDSSLPFERENPLPAYFTVKVHFNPETWRRWEETIESQEIPMGLGLSFQEDLRKVLEQSGEYCQKLAGAALDFICEETIKEIQYNYGILGGQRKTSMSVITN